MARGRSPARRGWLLGRGVGRLGSIGTSSRSAPRMRAAQADLAALSLGRESEALSLEATLVDAHLRLSAASARRWRRRATSCCRSSTRPNAPRSARFVLARSTTPSGRKLQSEAMRPAASNCLPRRSASRPHRNSTTHRSRRLSRPISEDPAMSNPIFPLFLAALLPWSSRVVASGRTAYHHEDEHASRGADRSRAPRRRRKLTRRPPRTRYSDCTGGPGNRARRA